MIFKELIHRIWYGNSTAPVQDIPEQTEPLRQLSKRELERRRELEQEEHLQFERQRELNEQRHLLESLIQNEWEPSRQLFLDHLEGQCIELEQKGFSQNFGDKFNEFVQLLYIVYDNVIKGENIELLLQHPMASELWDLKRDKHSLNLLAGMFNSLHSVPAEERYKLKNPYYLLARSAKELVKVSPVGVAIAEYRKDHPFLLRYPLLVKPETYARFTNWSGAFSDDDILACQGTDQLYHPHIGFELHDIHSPQDLQAGRPILNGSDAGEADYYFAAFDLLDEKTLLSASRENTFSLNYGKSHQSALSGRVQLVRSGLHLPERYAQKFLLAQYRLEKYGANLIHHYLSESPSTLEVDRFFGPFLKRTVGM